MLQTFKWTSNGFMKCGTQQNLLVYFKTWQMLKGCFFSKTFMAPIKNGVLACGGSPIGALSSPCSIVVVMKTSSNSTTSLLKWASFRKTTFHLGFFKSLKKNTCVTWLRKMKDLDDISSLCRKLIVRNPTPSLTYVGFPWLFSCFIHSHLKIRIGVCTCL